MPKQAQRANYNAFIKGLNTESSPLNFPENASIDELNFELNNDGTRNRRLGMDYEDNHAFISAGAGVYSASNITTFLWESVNGDVNLDFLVAQVDHNLFFFDVAQTSISGSGYKGTVNPSGFPIITPYSFAAVDGYLIVTAGTGDIVLISYNESANTFSQETHRLLVRDQWGLQETTGNYESDITYRNAALANEHYYNLQNQSWGAQRYDDTGTAIDPVQAYFVALGLQPSNSEQVWPALQYQPVAIGQPPFERIYPNLWNELFGATSQIAKGYFTIDLLNRGASRQAAFNANKTKFPALIGSFTSAHADSTAGGATVLTDFAGRIFYAGFNGALTDGDARSPVLTNHVVFSQLVKSKSDFFKCYQEGDPTSRDNAELVATDGGFIRISGCKKIISMKPLGNSLIVLAANGVWAITGGDTNSGFTATNYKVTKISAFGAIGPNSVVAQGNTLYYWSDDGMYVVGPNQFGDFQAQNISQTTIQSLYQSIPLDSKASAQGIYDAFTQQAKWVYKTGTAFSSSSQTFELIFSIPLAAWTRHLISTPPTYTMELFAPFKCTEFNTVSTDASSDLLSVKYLVMQKTGPSAYSFTFSYDHDETFRDWVTLDGVGTDAKAYVLTGTATAGDPAVDKQIPYLMMYFERTEQGVDENFQPLHQSSCLYRGQWDFANSIISNRWSPLRQAYRYKKPLIVEDITDTYDNGFEVLYTKNKLRGKGKAFSLYFETEPYKDCHILGWNLTVNAEQIT